jgi:hypothetical protein
MKKYFLISGLLILLTLPIWMLLSWILEGKKELKIVMVDKTSLTAEGAEHRSFNWILNYEKYCMQNRSLYSISSDYYGFFPKNNGRYEIKGLENFSEQALLSLSNQSDMAYFTDTYGIYRNEWYGSSNRGNLSACIYGGMSDQDITFLELMKARHKLILTEYNDIASPTTKKIKGEFENLFKVRWTGWAGRYFESLDTTVDKEIPVWLVRDYKLQHNNKWQFKNSGIAFVNDNGRIEILENKKDLKDEVPYILTNETNRERFNIPKKVKYSYWFDVMLTSHSNNVVSVYQIKATARGDSILSSINIPNPFPAVIEHYDKDYKFYYFCGDFCDNPIDMLFSNFLGITSLRWMLYSENDVSERTSFFWLYYQPLVSNILKGYYNFINKR